MDSILLKVRLRLGVGSIPDAQFDELIIEYAGEAVQRVLDYCNIAEIPEELESTIARMVVEMLRADDLVIKVVGDDIIITDAGGELVVTSLSEQGASITYGKPQGVTASAKQVVSADALNTRWNLHKWRRLAW